MFSGRRLVRMVRRSWARRAQLQQRSNHVASTWRLYLEALEDRLCPSGGYLVVASYDNQSILRYNESTGAFVDQIDPKNQANLFEPVGMVFGRNGNLYVSDRQFISKPGNPPVVLQYNGTTGAFQSDFASQNIGSPRGILFGPDGDLYAADGGVGSNGNATIDRFDGRTGAFLNYFVSAGSGGIAHPGFMVFGPDGNLYVGDVHAGQILRYFGPNSANPGAPDPVPGQTGAIFVPPAVGGLDAPQGITFGPDGNLYVASGNWFTSSNGSAYSGDFPPGAVLKFEGPAGPNPGVFLGTFIQGGAPGSGGLANPEAVLFGSNGDLYVSSLADSGQNNNNGDFAAEPGSSMVLRYNGTTGAFLSTFVTPDSGGLRCPISMTFTETDPTTLNYDGATTGTPLTAATTSPPTQLAAADSTTSAANAQRASSLPSSSNIDPAALSVALSLSQVSATQAALSLPSLDNSLPTTGSSQQNSPSEAVSDRIFANLDAGLPFAMLMEDLALVGGSSDELTTANPKE